MASRKTRILTTIAVIFGALALITIQLSQFAVDATLRHWHENASGFQAALDLQKTSQKAIAVFFHTDWCASCKKLREEVLSTPEFDQYLKNVIPVKINPETGLKERQIADKYGVLGYPTFLIIEPGSQTVTRIRTSQNITPQQFIDQCRTAQQI
ncbi:thioredoxin family protein [Kaarinaea lacus]